MVIVGIGPLKVTAGEGITDQKSGQPGASAVTRRIRAVSRKAPRVFDMGRGERGQLVSNYRLCKEGPTEVAGFGSPRERRNPESRQGGTPRSGRVAPVLP